MRLTSPMRKRLFGGKAFKIGAAAAAMAKGYRRPISRSVNRLRSGVLPAKGISGYFKTVKVEPDFDPGPMNLRGQDLEIANGGRVRGDCAAARVPGQESSLLTGDEASA